VVKKQNPPVPIVVEFGEKYKDKKTGFIGVCRGKVIAQRSKTAILVDEDNAEEKTQWVDYKNLLPVG
jgi:hypothetical protein